MLDLIKPPKLNKGDKVATVSLSAGIAGDPEHLWRYQYGVSRLRSEFGLEVVAMPHSLKGSGFIYSNPKARAEDLMTAFADPSVKGIISNIGGSDSIRLLPYIDFDIVRKNPKVFMGFSDTTSVHLMCVHAGLSTFYGTSVLCEFSENVAMQDYTKNAINKALFSTDPIGEILPAAAYTTEYPDWVNEAVTKSMPRAYAPNTGFEVLQGRGTVRGQLLGGCFEVMEMCKGTEAFPPSEQWRGAVLFMETSEDRPDPAMLTYWLRSYGVVGVLNRICGIIVGKPHGNAYYSEYKTAILKVLKEFDLTDLPVLFNLPFGHTCPTCVLPYGASVEIDCDNKRFSILESGVL